MPLRSKQGAAFSAPPSGRLEDRMPDWHALWVFLELHRSGGFRACERRLTMTVSSIRRRLNSLEASLGLRLLTRHPDGIRLTPEGERVAEIAGQMEERVVGLLHLRDTLAQEANGPVRIAVTEGLGAVWLTPQLVQFQRHSPGLRINLACAMTSADVLRMEADVAIQLTRPEALDVKVVRLGHLHLFPYASAAYLAEHGTPADLSELARHRLAVQIAEQAESVEHLSRVFASVPFTGTIANTTNASSAHILAIANGAGIGWLPTYVSPLRAGLIPVSCGVTATLEIWMTYHPDIEQVPRVRRTIDWLKASFDPRRYPFFAEELILPDDLPIMQGLVPLQDLFQGFVS